ncbi:MAG: leucine-rich repeat domain-containing protein [Clostridia bacterium]|nr:leucine-rich repeat domain-containing protein [Clostridia bacterium]
MKRLLIAALLLLMMFPLSAAGEAAFSQTGEVVSAAGEHFCYTAAGDHAVLTRYWLEEDRPQPPVVTVPAEVNGLPLTVIGWGAFDARDLLNTGRGYRDWEVERIVLPEGVTALENGAFLCANNVGQIELPSSLSVISAEGMTFDADTADIVFPRGNPFYRSEDGFLTDTRASVLLYCGKSSAGKPLPEVSRIGKNALENCISGKTELIFPASVTRIGSFSVSGDSVFRLKRVTIPSGTEEIDDFAFYDSALATAELAEGLIRIGAFAFSGSDLERVSLPSTVTWVGYQAFDEQVEVTGASPSCHWETQAEYEARYGIETHAGAEVVWRSAKPLRVLEYVRDQGSEYLRVIQLDAQGKVFTTRALPPFTAFDTYHDGGVSILVDVTAEELPEGAGWDEALEADSCALDFSFEDGEWRLTSASNREGWVMDARDGVWRFDDYMWYDEGWEWETAVGEDRLTEMDFLSLVQMAEAYNEARPDRPSLHWDEWEDEWDEEDEWGE